MSKKYCKQIKITYCIYFVIILKNISIPIMGQAKDSIRFIESQYITEVSKARSVAIGDFNDDGKNDIALGVWGPSFTDGNRLRIYYQNNLGKIIETPVLYDTLLFASDMQAIDIDQDGKDDLVVADQFGEGIVLYRQTPDGKLQKKIITEGMTGCLSLRVADLNNDHRLDIITTRVFYGLQDSFHVFYQGVDGGFEINRTYSLEKSFHLTGEEYSWSNIQAADFNNDSLTDVLISGGKFTNQISIYLQNPSGELKYDRHFAFDSYLRNVAVGDFTGDGRIDIAACRFFVDFIVGAQIGLFIQDSSGVFPDVPEYFPASERPIAIFSRDLDQDGKLDLLVSHDNRYELSCYHQTDTGRFEPYIKIPCGNRDAFLQATIAIGDFSSDGMPDIASTSSPGTLYLLVNDTKKPGSVSVKNINSVNPNSYSMSQNYPNPFNPATTIRYGLSSSSRVSLKIYNVLGQQIADIVNTEQSAGWYETTWNASVSSGLYFYRIDAVSSSEPNKRFTQLKKMILLK